MQKCTNTKYVKLPTIGNLKNCKRAKLQNVKLQKLQICKMVKIQHILKIKNENMQTCKKYNGLQKLQICKIAKIANMQSWEPTVWEPTVLGILFLGPAAHSPPLTATGGSII